MSVLSDIFSKFLNSRTTRVQEFQKSPIQIYTSKTFPLRFQFTKNIFSANIFCDFLDNFLCNSITLVLCSYLFRKSQMASSTPTFIVNATSIDFESISTISDEAMKTVFNLLEVSGLKGFFGISSQAFLVE